MIDNHCSKTRGRGPFPLRMAAAVSLALMVVPPAGADDLDEIKLSGVLRVVTEIDPSQAFENELIEGFARLHGLKVQMVTGKAVSERIPTLLSRQADVALSLFDTPERRQLADFTIEVIPAVHTIATCRPQAVVVTIEELRGRRVGMMQGSIIEQTARDAGVSPASILVFPNITDLVKALCEGKVTAALAAVPDLVSLRQDYPGLEYRIPFGQVRSAGWAIRKEDKQLRAACNEYLSNVRRGGGWSRLIVKHWGSDALAVIGRTWKESSSSKDVQ